MHDDSAGVEGRIARFVRDWIEPARYRASVPLAISAWEAPGEPVGFDEAIRQSYRAVVPGSRWGRPWGTTWFRLTGTVPEWTLGPDPLELVVDLGFLPGGPGFQAEGLVYRPDGTIIKAIEPWNHHVPVPGGPGDRVDVVVEAASNPDFLAGLYTFTPTPMGDPATAGAAELYTFRTADLRLRDVQVWELDRDLWTLTGLLAELDPTDARRAEILRCIERALDVIDPWQVSDTATAGRRVLAEALGRPANASAHRVAAVGHAHIDSAWLWPIRETIRKCARTFANVLQLMDDDPDFVFVCSSAQQFAWIKQHYPELFARIVDRVAQGRFIPVGGMWVESDANLPGGEAMARQFLVGKSFFLREFGFEPTEVWLPDSFGYSAALPQIIAQAGSRSFLTQKLSWNDTNQLPHHSFLWEGIDGTRIFTHFPPVATYNSDLSGADLARAARGYAEKGRGSISLVPFGHGDGGGGPTREMLAAAARTRSLEGSPRVRMTSPAAFFAEAEAELDQPPVWAGELYLEFHRGTYTSQARTKRGNRRSEHLLREAELWASTATVREGAEYPYAVLQECWERVLLMQFHDILPGSSIAWVYQDAEKAYAEVELVLEDLIGRALAILAGDGAGPLLANAAPFAAGPVPPLGIAPPGQIAATRVDPIEDRYVLESAALRAVIDDRGHLVSLIDLATGREFIPAGLPGNDLQLFRDTPNGWDAWDVDRHYRRTPVGGDRKVLISVDAGVPSSPALVIETGFGSSTVVQTVRLIGDRPVLDIETRVDWHEHRKLLKLAFPFDLHTDRATSEIQFGHLERATHENTSWDVARFETSAHRWMRIAETDAGIAVVNDATYGHDVLRLPGTAGGTVSVLRQSLLRAPQFPDPGADQGEHVFRTRLRIAPDVLDAVEEGYAVNLPRRVILGDHPVAPLVTVSHPGVVVEAVKLAEDRSGDLVIRLYEARGARCAVVVSVDRARSIVATDLLERPVDSPWLESIDDAAHLALRPFQLVTLRARLG